MQSMKQAAWIAVATLAVSGCASHNGESSTAFARHPQLKSSKTAYGSSRKQEQAPESPRILPETYYAAGRVFEQQGAPDKAIEQYRKAIAVNHEYTAAYARLGLMLSLTGQHEDAADAFTRAVELKPGSAILQNNLGFELLYQERWDEAERHLREATRLDTKLTQAHINLGLLLGRTQRSEQAVEAFQQVLPEPDAYYNLGLLQRAQGQYPQAMATFRRVLTINPKFTAAQRQLALVERKVVDNEPIPGHQTTSTTTEHNTLIAAAPATEVITDVPTTTATSTSETKSLVDLSALIDSVIPNPSTPEPTPTINQYTTTTTTTHAGEQTSATPSNTVHIGAPTPAPTQPISQRDTTPTTSVTVPAEIVTPDSDTQVVEVISAETMEALSAPEPKAAIAPQPLTGDLVLTDIARALNVADNQKIGFEQLAVLTGQPEPMPVRPVAATDAPQGTSLPQSDEVVLVLGTNETRTDLSPETTKSKLAVVPELSPEGQRSMNALNDMESSVQIIRNEIDCQKEYGSTVPEGGDPTTSVQTIPVNYTPVDQVLMIEQRTDLGMSHFGAPDDPQTMVYEDPNSATATIAVQEAKPGQDEVVEKLPESNLGSPASLAAPAEKPRRHRGIRSRTHR